MKKDIVSNSIVSEFNIIFLLNIILKDKAYNNINILTKLIINMFIVTSTIIF